MLHLSGFSVIDTNGIERVAFTFDEISESGDIVSSNNKKSFFAVNEELKSHIQAIKNFISENKMGD